MIPIRDAKGRKGKKKRKTDNMNPITKRLQML
jgi:hypothetical protein